MTKKAKREITEAVPAESGKVSEKKKLTRKHKIIITVAVIVLAAIIALSVALPLTLGKAENVNPYFLPFDQKSDYAITAEWKKIRNADNYTVEYCFGERTENNIIKIVTSNNYFAVPRQKGVLSLRVRANSSDAVFSEWIATDIAALKLPFPSVSIDNKANVTWTAVRYDYFGEKTEVAWYSVDIGIDGEFLSHELPYKSGDSAAFAAYIKSYVSAIWTSGMEWTDIVFSVRVKATADPYISSVPTEKEAYLMNAYEDGNYGYAELRITQEIYQGL